MKKKLIFIVLMTLFWALPVSAETQAAVVVERLHGALLEAMQQGDSGGLKGRAEHLRPVIDSSFDFNTIARIVTGPAWKTLDEASRSAFIAVFRDLSTATYASNFSAYGGEKFVTGASEDTRGAVIVHTELIKADGEAIPLNYMLRKNNETWLIVNVIAQGVSDLSLKRAEYSAVIKSEGFDSLLDRLRGKVKEINQAR